MKSQRNKKGCQLIESTLCKEGAEMIFAIINLLIDMSTVIFLLLWTILKVIFECVALLAGFKWD